MSTAPYVDSPLWPRTILEAGQPEWHPSPGVIALLSHPDPAVAELREWIGTTRRRGLCERCHRPITWTTKPRITCDATCRQRRSRARRDLLGSARDDAYLRDRHETIRAVAEERHHRELRRIGTHAGGVHKAHVDLPDGISWHSGIGSVRRSENLALYERGDDAANQWMREHKQWSDGDS